MIAIVNYGIGNIGSILNMFKKLGSSEVIFTKDKDLLLRADKILLPGVGSFDKGMQNLEDSGLIPTLTKCAFEDKKPFLGICLGMQLLTKRSDEGKLPGLGWIDAETLAFNFPASANLKIPHMGWDYLKVVKENPLLDPSETPRFYFVHSYYVKCNQEKDILAQSYYGHPFTCAIQHNNIFATQFHPEKSHKFGMKLLQNFSNL